jgi:hypothetical protein
VKKARHIKCVAILMEIMIGIGLLTNMSWKFPRRFSVNKTIEENIFRWNELKCKVIVDWLLTFAFKNLNFQKFQKHFRL